MDLIFGTELPLPLKTYCPEFEFRLPPGLMKICALAFLFLSQIFAPNPARARTADTFDSVYAADTKRHPERRLKSITRTALDIDPYDYGDPSAPQLNCDGDLVVTTTGGFELKWSRSTSELAWQAFLKGEQPEMALLKFHHDIETPLSEEHGEDVWDPVRYCLNDEEVLIGSLMTRPPGSKNASWPQDHWSRRTFVFRSFEDIWIPDAEPFFSPLPENGDWHHHNYGHGLLVDENGDGRVFYERVSEAKDGFPIKTEIFSRNLHGFLNVDGPETEVLKIGKQLRKSALRSDGGSLIEGPRPFEFEDQVGISFSAGDYNSDSYGIHVAIENDEGTFEPLLDGNNQLLDLGKPLKEYLPMTWGPGRATFFQHENQWWALFHGVPVGSRYDVEEARRDLFLAPVRLSPGEDPEIEILVQDE